MAKNNEHTVTFTGYNGAKITESFPCKSSAIDAVLRAAKRELRKKGHVTITIDELDEQKMTVLFKRADEYIDAVTL